MYLESIFDLCIHKNETFDAEHRISTRMTRERGNNETTPNSGNYYPFELKVLNDFGSTKCFEYE